MSVRARSVGVVRSVDQASAGLWVDPEVHAAECARFESFIVTFGRVPSAPMGTAGTERRRHSAAESELSAAATGRTTDQSKRNCLCCNLISRRQSRGRGTISDRTQPGI